MVKNRDTQPTRWLALDDLTAEMPLARRLPRELAYRYHALPVAQNGERITVVMANPDDPEAACAITAALGTMPYTVRGDREAIDALLAQVWSAEDWLHMLVCAPAGSTAGGVWLYAQALSELLGARLSAFESAEDLDALTEEVARVGHDLLIFGEPCQSLFERLLFGSADCRAARCVPTSLLTPQGYRWPLQRILLVMRHEKRNGVALEWAVRLARPSGAAVTILATVPPVPAMYGQRGRMQQGLTALLSTDTPLGREMRRLARRLEDERIEGTLRLRQGPHNQQLQLEVVTGNYDLIIVSADPDRWWLRWLVEEQVNSLLRWADRPVLIAKPTTA